MRNANRKTVSALGRAFSALFIVASLMVSVIGLPTPAVADEVVRDHRAKDAWLEVVINKITIHDDRDWGEGEFRFQAVIGSMENCPDPAYLWGSCLTQLAKATGISFNANDGNVRTINRVVPQMGDVLSTSLDEDAGITVHPDVKYGIEISGVEVDPAFDDQMGWTHLVLANAGDLSIGTHTIRGSVNHSLGDIFETISCDGIVCSNDFGWSPAHYSVELEVRKAALADLTPTALKIVNRESLKPPEKYKEICLTVNNIGPKPALGYDVNFLLDSTPYSAAAGAAYPGDNDEVCTRIPDPVLGEHSLNAVIAGVPEMDLSNNEMKSTYVRTVLDDIRAPLDSVGGVLAPVEETDGGPSGPAGGGPVQVIKEPLTLATKVDLAVSSIQVKGKNANSRSDCDPGGNNVQVTVKNQGTAKASDLVVSLAVDEDAPKEKPLASLDPGMDASVQFDDVQLKKGERKLVAAVALKGTSGDSPELKSTVSCQDE